MQKLFLKYTKYICTVNGNPNIWEEWWILRSMKGNELGEEEYEKLKDGQNRYVKIEGIESVLVNIPTIVTGINDDGTIRQEEIQAYACEVVDQNNKGIDG